MYFTGAPATANPSFSGFQSPHGGLDIWGSTGAHKPHTFTTNIYLYLAGTPPDGRPVVMHENALKTDTVRGESGAPQGYIRNRAHRPPYIRRFILTYLAGTPADGEPVVLVQGEGGQHPGRNGVRYREAQLLCPVRPIHRIIYTMNTRHFLQ